MNGKLEAKVLKSVFLHYAKWTTTSSEEQEFPDWKVNKFSEETYSLIGLSAGSQVLK